MHMWQSRIRRDISAAEMHPEKQGSHAHTRLLNPEHQCREEESPYHLAVNTSRDPRREGCYRFRHPLTRPAQRLTDKLTSFELQHWGSSFRVRAGEIALATAEK